MKLSKTSMLYRSAKCQGEFLNMWWKPANDLCTFLRRYFAKMLGVFLLGLLGGGLGLSILTFLAAVSVNGFHGIPLEETPFIFIGFIATMVAIFFAIAAAVGLTFSFIKRKFFARGEDYEPGVIATAWRSYREKYCAKIEYVD